MKVLIADDSATTRLLLESVVAARGHDLVCVPDGDAAWSAYKTYAPTLVILDWQMPGLDGIEVCRRVKASPTARDSFVLMVTGRTDDDDVVSALDAGADDYLFKPLIPPVVIARLTIAERRIALNHARWAAEEALASAQWLAGVGQTALAIQHEVNNPLAALLGNVQLMLMDEELARDARTLAEETLAQARRVAAVVKRLSALEAPRTVEYLVGEPMLDLSDPPAT
jgi:DNA-binding response OmpR family regulator